MPARRTHEGAKFKLPVLNNRHDWIDLVVGLKLIILTPKVMLVFKFYATIVYTDEDLPFNLDFIYKLVVLDELSCQRKYEVSYFTE